MDKNVYDCIIVGGGIAGLQAAVQLGRYQHHVLVIDSNNGRSNLCRKYHNILGFPDGVSGETLRELGRKQASSYGIVFEEDKVLSAAQENGIFTLETESGKTHTANRLLLSTGVMDRIPPIPNIKPCLGMTLFVCPDCDGYEVIDKSVIIMGSGKPGAKMALEITYWTKDITYINHEKAELDEALLQELRDNGITYIEEEIEGLLTENTSNFKGVRLANGQQIDAERGFIAFGGNEVRTDLAKMLGVERLENKHVLVDPRTKQTKVKNVWAAGDIVAHSEQSTIAMGEATQAAIWIHKSILSDKKSKYIHD
ncbi:FAD-dependent oxidoreductase [Bacillus lacus]|uniref:FAD-dependent oxidoreductase n=1 Tax=Metabacillus lacus TaxID=1983721 RepID=A0A7X2LYL9_9BACI|nr:FAD-dependent oxidoreductase [Metabacillus lacus]